MLLPCTLQYDEAEEEEEFFDNEEDALYDLPLGGGCWRARAHMPCVRVNVVSKGVLVAVLVFMGC
jgi:hypothetical protein